MNAIYCRVSTDAQAEQGYSLADQIRSCHARAATLGIPTSKESEFIDDGYSGEYLDRPALDRLRDALHAKLIQNVIVYDPDRLSRNLTNQLIIADEIEKSGSKLFFVTGDYDASPEGRLFFTIRGAISAFEKEKIRERSMRGKRSKALSGKLVFNDDLYGYIYDKEKSMYTINPEEAKIVKAIFHLYTSRGYGINSLYAELKSLGILNRKGKPFNASTLHYILGNETYAGIKWCFSHYFKSIGQKKRKRSPRNQSEWISVEVPAIIDRETWEAAVKCREMNKITAKRNTKYEYLLQNIIRCECCGYAMRGVTYRRKEKKYPYYVCTAYVNNNPCSNRKCVPSHELDEAVWNDILSAAKNKRGLAILQNKANNNISAKLELQKQLDELKLRQAAITRWVSIGRLDIAMADKDLENLQKEISSTQTAINAITIPATPSNTFDIKEILSAETFEEKRNILLRSGVRIYAKREDGKTAYTIKL